MSVIVIGAGAAGIAAATRLYRGGITNLIILEAENRIGGRIFTDSFAGKIIDIGAQWCHGEEDNVVYDLVKDKNLLGSTEYYSQVQLVDSRGIIVPENVSERLQNMYVNILYGNKEEMDQCTSLGEFVTKTYYRLVQEDDILKTVSRDILDAYLDVFHKFLNSLDAANTFWETSAPGHSHYWECEGNPLLNWKGRGFQTILDLLLGRLEGVSAEAPFPVAENILTNKVVTQVCWQAGPGQPAVTVYCGDGTRYVADHVIVTMSLGVLKEKHRQIFVPELPSYKQNVIQGLGFGVVDKIFLEFTKPWWPEDFNGVHFLWKNDDKRDRDCPHPWVQDVFGCYRVDDHPNILCGWVSGSSAKTMEALPEEEVLQHCTFLLNKFLGQLYKITQPIQIRRSSWFSNQHFRGSYSFRSVDSHSSQVFASQLALPLHDSFGRAVVLFAGEATHEHYYSTVHGAIQSGHREADRILLLNQIQSKL